MTDLLIIGAVALDRPVRLNGPLGPGVRLQGRSLDGRLGGRLGGGGANAGAALARAGRDVAIAGFVAEDADGDAVLALARAAGLDVSRIHRRPGASRITLILIDPDGERAVVGLDAEPLTAPSLPAPSREDAFRGLYVRAGYPGAAAWAAVCRGPVIAHWPAGAFAGPCDVLIASADDCDAAFLADPLAAGRMRMGDRLGWTVLTHGARAVVAHGADGTLRVEPAPAKVVDATGAGDVFAAGLLDALTAGAGMEDALRHACRWGAIAVGLDGSAPVDGEFAAFRPAAP